MSAFRVIKISAEDQKKKKRNFVFHLFTSFFLCLAALLS